MKDIILKVCRFVGLFALARRLTRRGLRVLCYHGIWDDAEEVNRWRFLYMTPEKFARRMKRLRQMRYPLLPLGEALRRLDDGTLPRDAVAITIDDGWDSTAQFMVPLLAELGLPATVYLTTYYVEHQAPVFDVTLNHILRHRNQPTLGLSGIFDGRDVVFELDSEAQRQICIGFLRRFALALPDESARTQLLHDIAARLEVDLSPVIAKRRYHLMSPDSVRYAAALGIDFQLHTHRHRLGEPGSATLSNELADNRAALSRILGYSFEGSHFCYPSGVFRADCAPVLAAAGVVSATTTDSGFVWRSTERYALPRILDGELVSDVEFEAELSGLLEIKRAVLTWLQRITKS